MYSLAYKEMFGKIPDRVELHFLEHNLIGSTKSTQKELDEAVKNIDDSAYGIRNAIYDPTPGYNTCRYCAYNEVCPSTAFKE
jgi:DNA helicase-2/ATP-dependent DNA helicase PcrA